MRLSLLLFLFPLLTNAQLTDPGNFYFNRELRVGVQTQMDWNLLEPYTTLNNMWVLQMDRPQTVSLKVDYQIFKHKKILYATAGISQYEIQAPGDSTHFTRSVSDYRQKFQEQSSVDFWQLALGLGTEIFGQSRCSPYIQVDALIARPTATTYEIRFDETSDDNFPNYLFIQGGTRTSLGFQIRSGLRVNILRRISISAGLYFANLNLKHRWPELPRRPLDDTFMELENGGLEFSCQYRIGLGKTTIATP